MIDLYVCMDLEMIPNARRLLEDACSVISAMSFKRTKATCHCPSRWHALMAALKPRAGQLLPAPGSKIKKTNDQAETVQKVAWMSLANV